MISRKRVDIVDIKLIREEIELEKQIIGNPTNTYNFMKMFLSDLTQEILIVLCLNADNEPTTMKAIALDSANMFTLNVANVMRFAILSNSSKIILANNHPNGDPSPTRTDKYIYKKMKKDGKTLGIDVLDHIIISGKRYYSFLENQLLFEKTKN